MARNVSVKQVLRLLCLLSSVSGGLKSRDYDQLRQSFIMAYGPQYLITFEKLSKANLFNKRSANANTSSSSYNQIRKAFNLVVDEINERTPDDIAYVYSGYAPLSVRLTQCIFEKSALKESNSTTTDSYQKKQTSKTINIASSLSSTVGWRGFEEPLTLLQGPAFDEVQRGDSQAARAQGTVSFSPLLDAKTNTSIKDNYRVHVRRPSWSSSWVAVLILRYLPSDTLLKSKVNTRL